MYPITKWIRSTCFLLDVLKLFLWYRGIRWDSSFLFSSCNLNIWLNPCPFHVYHMQTIRDIINKTLKSVDVHPNLDDLVEFYFLTTWNLKYVVDRMAPSSLPSSIIIYQFIALYLDQLEPYIIPIIFEKSVSSQHIDESIIIFSDIVWFNVSWYEDWVHTCRFDWRSIIIFFTRLLSAK